MANQLVTCSNTASYITAALFVLCHLKETPLTANANYADIHQEY